MNNDAINEQIKLTPSALAHFRQQLAKRGKGIGIHFGIKTVGCSGKKYVIDITDAAAANDYVFDAQGLTIYVDAKSYPYVKGTTIDYGREGLNETLKFDNPNAKNACGCGESFNIE